MWVRFGVGLVVQCRMRVVCEGAASALGKCTDFVPSTAGIIQERCKVQATRCFKGA